GGARGAATARPPAADARGHGDPPAPVGGLWRSDAGEAARPVRLRTVGPAQAPAPAGPRPLRHLPALLDAADERLGRLAVVRVRSQGAARLRDGRGATRRARH